MNYNTCFCQTKIWSFSLSLILVWSIVGCSRFQTPAKNEQVPAVKDIAVVDVLSTNSSADGPLPKIDDDSCLYSYKASNRACKAASEDINDAKLEEGNAISIPANEAVKYTDDLLSLENGILPPPQVATPMWFKVEERFAYKDDAEGFIIHSFFDLLPYPNLKKHLINFVPLSYPESKFQYGFDTVSGKRFKKFTYCKQRDAWDRYGKIERPPFTEGIVPRMLGQMGTPLKIYVFGSEQKYQEQSLNQAISYRVKVIGGVIEEFCGRQPCQSRREWLSQLILLAVDPADPTLGKIETISDLKKVKDWEYIRAFMENAGGRTVVQDKIQYPAYRVIGEIGADKALGFTLKNGHYFKFTQMQTLAQSCFRLYDYVWDEVHSLRKNQVTTTKSFASFFGKFYDKHGENFRFCSRFVRPATISDNVDRNWFFAYFIGFFKMEELDMMYSCRNKSWQEAPLTERKKIVKGRYDDCLTEQLDSAFQNIPFLMANYEQGGRPYFRYINFDSAPSGGTHQKIFSWVFFSGKRFGCSDPGDLHDRKNPEYFFPSGVDWVRFGQTKIEARDRIIE